MEYQIKEFSSMTGLSSHTLRYYEKEGLLPSVQRNHHGVRSFSDQDLERIKLINCLKVTGMPIKEIRQFITLCQQGESTFVDRLALLQERKKVVLQQLADLERSLEHIDFKIEYYESAVQSKHA